MFKTDEAFSVTFERYEEFDQDERGISHGEESMPSVAWFTDPAGNVLSLIQE